MYLMYTANEICQQIVAPPFFETDIYSWSDVLPVSNDTLLVDALKVNKRPSVTNIIKRYAKDESDQIIPLIYRCWDWDPNKALGIDEVIIFMYFHMKNLFSYLRPLPNLASVNLLHLTHLNLGKLQRNLLGLASPDWL